MGPQQVVLISNTHRPGKHIYGTGRGRKERRKPWLSNEKMVSYTGSSTGSTHTQHSHTMQTQRMILRSRGDRKG